MEGDPCTEMTACIVCMILMTSRLLSCQFGLRRARDVTPPQTPGNKAPERRRFAAISRHQSKRPTFLNSPWGGEGPGAGGVTTSSVSFVFFALFFRFLLSFFPLPLLSPFHSLALSLLNHPPSSLFPFPFFLSFGAFPLQLCLPLYLALLSPTCPRRLIGQTSGSSRFKCLVKEKNGIISLAL